MVYTETTSTDVVEKAFGNLKERLNMQRIPVSSEKGLDGKIFFIFTISCHPIFLMLPYPLYLYNESGSKKVAKEWKFIILSL